MDVLANLVQGFVVADDMFIIIPLPHWGSCGIAEKVDVFGGCRFESNHER